MSKSIEPAEPSRVGIRINPLHFEVSGLLKEFWRAQTAWGDASIEIHYANKIIEAVKGARNE